MGKEGKCGERKWMKKEKRRSKGDKEQMGEKIMMKDNEINGRMTSKCEVLRQKKVGFKLNLQWKGKYDDTWSKFLRMGQASNILFDKCMNE